MVEVWLPYGKTEVPVRIPDESFFGIVDAEVDAAATPVEEVLRAFDNPIGSETLGRLTEPGKKVAIVVDEVVFPYKLVLPTLIEQLTNRGIEESKITVILGCGIQNVESSRKRLINEIGKTVNFAISNIYTNDFIRYGNTSRGTNIFINKVLSEADLRILTGRIGFHPYAGYSGGRDGILPAICGVETIRRSGALIVKPEAQARHLEKNPFHQEMTEAAQMAKVDFIINVVLNSQGELVKAFAGDLDQAFLEGVKFMDEKFTNATAMPADIVVFSSGGSPWDVTLYQSCKGLASALKLVKDRGVIIWVAESPDGYGNAVFYDWMVKFKTAAEATKEIKKGFILGGEMAHLLLSALDRVKIILVSILPDYYATGIFQLKTARTVNAALSSAIRMLGKKSKVLVLPYGNTVFPIIKQA